MDRPDPAHPDQTIQASVEAHKPVEDVGWLDKYSWNQRLTESEVTVEQRPGRTVGITFKDLYENYIDKGSRLITREHTPEWDILTTRETTYPRSARYHSVESTELRTDPDDLEANGIISDAIKVFWNDTDEPIGSSLQPSGILPRELADEMHQAPKGYLLDDFVNDKDLSTDRLEFSITIERGVEQKDDSI